MQRDIHEWRSLGGTREGAEEYVLGDLGLTLRPREWGAEFWSVSDSVDREIRLVWKIKTTDDLARGLEILEFSPTRARAAAGDLWPRTVRAQRAANYRPTPKVKPETVEVFERNPERQRAADQLESAIHSGDVPAECLRPLLLSGEDRLLGPIIYILSETSPDPLLDELVQLMQTRPDTQRDILRAFHWGTQTTRGDVLAEILQSREGSARQEAKSANLILDDLHIEQVAALEAFVGDGELRESFDRWRSDQG